MQIRNVRGHTLEIAATGQVAEPEASVDVPDDIGALLLEQPDNWQPAKPSKKEN